MINNAAANDFADLPENQVKIADIVRSVNGRDSGKLLFAVALEAEYVMLADGRGRRIEKPKRKKLKHIQRVQASQSRAAEKLRSGEKVTNADLRRGLSELADEAAMPEGGMPIG